MKREIKFRAWDKDKSKMLAPFSVRKLINGFNTEGNWSDYEDDELLDINYEGSDEYELMQYTGLKDKSGTPIFESDIVRCPITAKSEDYLLLEAGAEDFVIRVVDVPDIYMEGLPDDCEVIGNIWQNPKLLTKST